MRIQDMFERDIDRDINGVVKVAQEDEAAVEQELSEYVVTRELSRHFASFFDSYEHVLDTPRTRSASGSPASSAPVSPTS